MTSDYAQVQQQWVLYRSEQARKREKDAKKSIGDVDSSQGEESTNDKASED